MRKVKPKIWYQLFDGSWGLVLWNGFSFALLVLVIAHLVKSSIYDYYYYTTTTTTTTTTVISEHLYLGD